jgi:hypothetical protein
MVLLTKWLALTVTMAIYHDVFFASLAVEISASHAGPATDSDPGICRPGP